MFFILMTAVITVLCLWGTIKALRKKNFLGIGIAGISVLVFGWFTVMETLEWLGLVGNVV